MAGLGRKVFEANEVLTAADVNGYLMDQAVMVFADSAARSSAIGSATEGMFTYLSDSDSLQYWDGSQWAGLDALPEQSGNAGFFLTTDGTVASWTSVQVDSDPKPDTFLLMGA